MGKYILVNRVPVPVNDVREWADWFETADRTVANDEGDGWRVRTVFLGLDHNWGDGPPLLFETLVFGGKLSDECDRYSTWEQAELGHKAMVQRVVDIQ
jgi:hypothetical protein